MHPQNFIGLVAVVAVPMPVIAIMFAISIAVSVITVPVPAMVVSEPPAIAIPVPVVILAAFIARAYPTCTLIRNSGPVSVVPDVTMTHRVPIAVHPHEIRTRTGQLPVLAHRRWGPNSNS